MSFRRRRRRLHGKLHAFSYPLSSIDSIPLRFFSNVNTGRRRSLRTKYKYLTTTEIQTNRGTKGVIRKVNTRKGSQYRETVDIVFLRISNTRIRCIPMGEEES